MKVQVGQRVAHWNNPKKTGVVAKMPYDTTYGIRWDDQPDSIVWMAEFALKFLEKSKTESLKQILANAESAFPNTNAVRL